MIPYLFLADRQNRSLSAILTFSDRGILACVCVGAAHGPIFALQHQAVAQ